MTEVKYELRASHEALPGDDSVFWPASAADAERKLRAIEYWISPDAAVLVSLAGRGDLRQVAVLLAARRLALLELRREVTLPSHRESDEPEAPPVVPPVNPDVERDWIEIELLDPDGRPMPGELCKVRRTDGTTVQRPLDAAGRLRFDGIPSGVCEVSFPALGSAGGVS